MGTLICLTPSIALGIPPLKVCRRAALPPASRVETAPGDRGDGYSLAGMPRLADGYLRGPEPILAWLHIPAGVVLQDEPQDARWVSSDGLRSPKLHQHHLLPRGWLPHTRTVRQPTPAPHPRNQHWSRDPSLHESPGQPFPSPEVPVGAQTPDPSSASDGLNQLEPCRNHPHEFTAPLKPRAPGSHSPPFSELLKALKALARQETHRMGDPRDKHLVSRTAAHRELPPPPQHPRSWETCSPKHFFFIYLFS